MSKAPPIPPAQQPRGGAKPDIEGDGPDRREPGLQTGDGEANLREQGSQGNIAQNVDTVQHKSRGD
ncbi:hypothetical protein [Phenylobacterium sp.]|uniref:hypothetical protein n=1 Tax=Phenylobacterium sp. TaxID=1871053 RepID=UPI002718F122|nr:hypothetical protein [Phenylobacterium sp.]MDO8378367.1 hypothetical protein [Phenylobacterium sp.]